MSYLWCDSTKTFHKGEILASVIMEDGDKAAIMETKDGYFLSHYVGFNKYRSSCKSMTLDSALAYFSDAIAKKLRKDIDEVSTSK